MMTQNRRRKNLQVKIDAEMHKRLKMAAVKRETTISQLVRELIADWLEKEEPPEE